MSANSPEELHDVLVTAFNWGDVDAFVRAYEDNATLIVPPDGTIARGRAQIRGAVQALITGNQVLSSDVLTKIESGGLALTRAQWLLTSTDPAGHHVSLAGRGTMVSRRQPDGTWLIVVDDPIGPDQS